MSNIVLIGMSGAGKSTIGVLLAKAMNLSFVDTDLLIQKKDGRLLHEIIRIEGIDYFKCIEEEVITELDINMSVIATGGSVVYSQAAMEHLTRYGQIVFIDVVYEEILKRLKNITTRGIVMEEGQTLEFIYHDRYPLYQKYCDIWFKVGKQDVEQTIEELMEIIG